MDGAVKVALVLHDVTLLYVCGLVYLAHSRLYLADDLLTLLRQQLLIILLHRLYKFGQFADTLVRLLRGDYLLYLFDNRKSIVLCLEILFFLIHTLHLRPCIIENASLNTEKRIHLRHILRKFKEIFLHIHSLF